MGALNSEAMQAPPKARRSAMPLAHDDEINRMLNPVEKVAETPILTQTKSSIEHDKLIAEGEKAISEGESFECSTPTHLAAVLAEADTIISPVGSPDQSDFESRANSTMRDFDRDNKEFQKADTNNDGVVTKDELVASKIVLSHIQSAGRFPASIHVEKSPEVPTVFQREMSLLDDGPVDDGEDVMPAEEVKARRKERRGRRMSQVERDMDDIFTSCTTLSSKNLHTRRKSLALREEAADCITRMSALIELGTTTKVVLAAAKWKSRSKFKHTENNDTAHVGLMHKQEQARAFGNFAGVYEGVTSCFVCDEEVSAADIKAALCPICSTVLNHTTIKCKKIPPKQAVKVFHSTVQDFASSTDMSKNLHTTILENNPHTVVQNKPALDTAAADAAIAANSSPPTKPPITCM